MKLVLTKTNGNIINSDIEDDQSLVIVLPAILGDNVHVQGMKNGERTFLISSLNISMIQVIK